MRKAIILAATLLLFLSAADASAIPAFARKYRVSCSLCHAPPPRLNAFGETFAGNGFAMSANEEPRDTIDTGDQLLRLLNTIQLALRLDLYGNATFPLRKDQASVDLRTPYAIKLLSGGEIAKSISYYMYFFLGERGEVAGLEDAYIQFTNVANSGVSLIAGQFQVSDPLFKRELRLQYTDYQLYRVRVGNVRPDLTYDRGLMALFSPWPGADATLMVVNGRGLEAAEGEHQYDRDNLKNYAARLSQEIGPLRVGGFAYFGQERGEDVIDDITVFGPDITLNAIPNIEINAQYLRRRDSNPFLVVGDAETEVNSMLGELLWSPGGPTGRVHAVATYNWIDTDTPDLISLRLGRDPLNKYHEASAGLHYLVQRNVRVSGEVGYDIERERTRFTIGGFFAW